MHALVEEIAQRVSDQAQGLFRDEVASGQRHATRVRGILLQMAGGS
jgi:hypothetical protein